MQRQLPMLQEKQAWQESDILYRSSAAFHFGFTGMEGGFLYFYSRAPLMKALTNGKRIGTIANM